MVSWILGNEDMVSPIMYGLMELVLLFADLCVMRYFDDVT